MQLFFDGRYSVRLCRQWNLRPLTPGGIGRSIRGSRVGACGFLAMGLFFTLDSVWADGPGDNDSLDEIIVTARNRAESLENVPDSVSVLSAETLASADVQRVSDFIEMTPNVTFRQTFREGASYITIRGITTGQGGWAPVTYVVDGVPAGSLDAINVGALLGVERIEVLKGPQSALYGAGAIAGAINVITKAPTNTFSGEAHVSYGDYGDRRATLSVSGPIINDAVLFRLDGYYRDANGSQEDTAGQGLNFDSTSDLRGKIIFNLDPVTIDLRAHVVHTREGAVYQELLPPGAAGAALFDDFTDSPGIRRGIVGAEDVNEDEVSLKVDWNAGFATLTSISAYSQLTQDLFGSATWNEPPAPGFCGATGGPGEPPDCFQTSVDDFKVYSQDLRLTSPSNQPLRWLVGASALYREAPNNLTVGAGQLDAADQVVPSSTTVVNETDYRRDRFTGVYTQVNYDITSALEATAAVRWDENRYDSTGYTNLGLSTPVPLPDGTVTQRAVDASTQPKLQLAYHWEENVMTYASVSKGFRSGFFYTGNLTKPEHTWNYEVGLKSSLDDRRVTLNAALFHINYSDQQFSTIVATPPYRVTSNIPYTKINGFELEIAARPFSNLTVGTGIGNTVGKVDDGSDDPYTPRITLNLWGQYSVPVKDAWNLNSRVDFRYQSSQYLGQENEFPIGGKRYVNLHIALTDGRWSIGAYGNNLTNEQQANEIDNVGFGYLRYNSDPRTFGGEVDYKF